MTRTERSRRTSRRGSPGSSCSRRGREEPEVVARHARGHVVGIGAAAEDVVLVAVDLVRPAHVLRQLSARDHVVADHGLGRHVADDRVREVLALALQLLDVGHPVASDRVRTRLVQHDDQHPLRGLVRLLRHRRRGAQRNGEHGACERENLPWTRHGPVPSH